MKIFLLEPSKMLRCTIKQYLHAHHFTVDAFSSDTEAIEAIDNGYNCFIIGMDCENAQEGLALLKSIRMYYREVPVLVMCLNDQLDISIMKKAYAFGCDDILKKPFFIEEINQKIVKLLHVEHEIVHFGDYATLDSSTGVLTFGSLQKHFTKKERRLLFILHSYRESVVSFATIRNLVWEEEQPTIDAIRSLVRRVRKKLPFPCIETVPDTGYILKALNLQRQ